jgi:hypothetical protein
LRTAWFEYIRDVHNTLVILGKETYFVREDGYLMPSRKDQPPPDLKYFNQMQTVTTLPRTNMLGAM